ncbi:MAG: FAD:protein FMN transferase [Planctomycetota bacterium]
MRIENLKTHANARSPIFNFQFCCSAFIAALCLAVGRLLDAAEPAGAGLQRFQFAQPHMGTLYRIVLYAPDEETAKQASGQAFTRIAQLDACMSDYKPDSELMRLCEKAGGEAVPVSAELFYILKESVALSRASNGAFDVSIGPLVRLWRIARRNREMPPAEMLAAAKALVGYEKIILDEPARTVRLLQKGMQLDLGGIGKGYAGDEAIAVLKKQGIERALVVAGGEVVASGPPPGLAGWTVGLAPLEDSEQAPAIYLLLRDAAVSTHGDAEQHVDIAGVRYSHHIDPKTGLALTGHGSVSVVAPRGTITDGLGTAVTLLGPEAGLKLVDATPNAAALILKATEKGEQAFESQRWKDVPKTKAKDEQK